MYKVQVSYDLFEVIKKVLESENLYKDLLKKEVRRRITPNIFEEAYKYYINKNPLHALRLFRRSINEMLKDADGKTLINETVENLKNIARVGDQYLKLFLIKLDLNDIEDFDKVLDIDPVLILKEVDYKDIDNLFMAAGHFLEAAETSLLLRLYAYFHLFYYKFLVCFNLIKRIIDIKRVKGADDLIRVHLEGMEVIESLLVEHYRLKDISELKLTVEEMFYTLENLKTILVSKYEDADYVGVIKEYFKLMGVIDAFEKSLLSGEVQP